MSRHSDKHKQEASQLRDRFWAIHKKRPDSIKNYAQRAQMHYRTFGDFVMARSILDPEGYATFENWVADEEKKL